MVGYLSLPIRLLGIVLMTGFLIKAMAPLRSMELQLSNISSGSSNPAVVATETPINDGSSLLSLGLASVALISIWLIYQTWRQHIGLAENELRNRRAVKATK